ncbi:MAG: response regulator [Caldilinea sp.]
MSQPTVLIVDDDAFARAHLRDALSEETYRILEAKDGEEAIAVLSSERPQVMLLDLLMPRRSGLEVLDRARQLCPDTRVLIISSMDVDGMVSQALDSGARDFISKPFHPVEIADAVAYAEASPLPDPATVEQGVYAGE